MIKLLSALVYLLVIVACSGCAARTATSDPVSSVTSGLSYYAVTRFVDHEAQVVCWKYAFGYAGGLSCLPLAETALDAAGGE